MAVNLVFAKKNGSKKIFPLPSSVTIIGRRRDCDLRIPIESVSRRHCQLNYSNGVLKIRDLSSRNGTSLNGMPVEEAVIKAGDSIEIGPLTFMLQIDGQPENLNVPETVEQKPQEQEQAAEDLFDSSIEDIEDIESLLANIDITDDDV